MSIHSQGQQGFAGTLIKNWDPAEGHTCVGPGLDSVMFLKEGSWMWSVGSAYDFDYGAAQEPNSVEGNKHCVDESYGPGHSFFICLTVGVCTVGVTLLVQCTWQKQVRVEGLIC